jgi:hypothetical protein
MRNIFTTVIIWILGISCFAQSESIITGTADTDVIAVVLDKKITVKEKDRLNRLIFSTLLKQYAKENNIEPTDEEFNTFVQKTEEKEKQQEAKYAHDREKLQEDLKSPTISEKDRKNKEAEIESIEKLLKTKLEIKERTKGMEELMRTAKRNMAVQFVKSWKINKSLYAKYGGRVIFQQAGPEPLDAYRDFLKEQEKKGAFEITDKSYEASFWKYFTNDAMHTFYKGEDGAKFINTPWWMMEQPQDK